MTRKRIALALLAALTGGCGRSARLPNYGEVPSFTLTSQDGQPFDSHVLKGNIWVADFIFTTCGGACPRMSSRMRQMQQDSGNMANVRLVSFTVDPEHDTPEQLNIYAKAFHADLTRWYFLTGPREALDHLGFDVFKLNRVDAELAHSTRFVLVDRDSRIRGYYDTREPDAISKLLKDVHTLEGKAS